MSPERRDAITAFVKDLCGPPEDLAGTCQGSGPCLYRLEMMFRGPKPPAVGHLQLHFLSLCLNKDG